MSLNSIYFLNQFYFSYQKIKLDMLDILELEQKNRENFVTKNIGLNIFI